MTAQTDVPDLIRRASIANLGCKVNQAEMDAVERLLRGGGVALVDSGQPADVVVVNTCTVTSVADRKSRQAIRRARRSSPSARVLVTGCSVAVDPGALSVADPAAHLYAPGSKADLLTELTALLELPAGAVPPTLSGVDPVEPWVVGPLETGEYEGSVDDGFDGLAGIDRTRAFVKVQDGCSFHCTYCIIPVARGSARSIPPDAVLADVRKTLAEGHREVVLTGINVGTYAGATAGDSPPTLAGLVRRVLAETTVERLRLSSIEPQHVTADLLDVWLESGGRCQPHFHIPLQSGDDTILRRMGRRYETESYEALVARIRGAIPDVAIHADVIVGFPGEDEAAWARTLAFLGKLDLAGVHVFRYSSRPGTPAARMVGQVDARTRKRRAAEALALAAEARAAFAVRQLGRELRVLFERPLSDGRWVGHAENHVPVAAAATDGRPLDNVIGSVVAESIEPAALQRISGRLVAVDRAAIPLRARGGAREPLAHRARK